MDKKLLEQFVAQGYSQRKIADEFGCSQNKVVCWLAKYGLGTKRIYKCYKCHTEKLEDFVLGRYRCCRKCKTIGEKRAYRGHKKKAVEYKGGKCEICGYNKCLAALDFHHVNPEEKDPRWKKMQHWKFENVKNELDKCMLVCRNCHAEIHYAQPEEIHFTKPVVAKIWYCEECGTQIKKGQKRCLLCRKLKRKEPRLYARKFERPSKEKLQRLLWLKSMTQIAIELGVSNKSIAKWAKAYSLETPPMGYWLRDKNL